MPFKIDTQTKGIYIISEDSIAHHFFSIDESSPGFLVKKHYTGRAGRIVPYQD